MKITQFAVAPLVSCLAALAFSTSVSSKPLFTPGTALPPPVETPSAETPSIEMGVGQSAPISLDLMKQITQRLSADDLEGRAPSSTTEPIVLDYIVRQFKAAGLEAGNNGRWMQDVPTVEINGSNHSPLTITGGKSPLSVAYGTQWVGASFRVTPKTQVQNSPLVFVGYGIVAPELGWNDYAGIDMRGKTAIILVNDPDYADESEQGLFKGRRMTYYGRWPYKFEEAARQGATGAIIVHDTFPAAYGWNVVQSSWSGSRYQVEAANDGMDQTQVNAWVQKHVAEQILAAAGQNLATLTKAAQTKGFKPVPLGLKASVSFDNAIRKSVSHNVVGILPGKTQPEEYVLYSAHWDHLGRCAPDATGDDICNGAVDNADGIAALTAIAKANVDAGAPARSQVFLAWTLEESGLLGSEFYAQNPIYPLSQTVGGVNMDAMRPGPRVRDYAMTGGGKSDLNDLFRKALTARGLVEANETGPEKGGYYRSDHFSMAKRGVPMFAIERGMDWVVGGKAASRAADDDYSNNRYHQPSDEYSPNWDWSGIIQDVELFYSLGRELANSTAWPNWRAGDEFRSVRDKSCAGKGGC